MTAWVVAVLAGAPSAASGAEPAPHLCEGVPVAVHGASARDAESACEGARKAFAFLAPLGMQQPPRIEVDIVPRLPPDLRADAVGCYQRDTRRVSVLTSAQFLARGRWFGVPTSRALYRTVVAHEVAHALVGCHLGERSLSRAANEYVAYVLMFETMDPPLRAAALAATPGQGFLEDHHINDLRYAFDPVRFGVDAYRHWRSQPDGMDYLRRIVAGELIPALPSY